MQKEAVSVQQEGNHDRDLSKKNRVIDMLWLVPLGRLDDLTGIWSYSYNFETSKNMLVILPGEMV